MEVLAAVCFALAGFIAVRAVRPRLAASRARLDEIAAHSTTSTLDETTTVHGRVVRPLADGLSGALASVLPEHIGRWLQAELAAAGMTLRPGVFVVMTAATVVLFGYPALVMAPDMFALTPPLRLLVALGGLGFGLFAPVIWLQGRANRRQKEIQRALPDTLDLIVVSVEAGLGFEAALARITEQQDGPLAVELRRVLADVNLGISRREAMQTMAARARSAGVSSLVAAILQSDRTGMGVGQVLRAQATHVRTLRRQHAEEAAMKAPLKMLFPLVFFIFPSLFVVVLGPAVLNLMQALGGQ